MHPSICRSGWHGAVIKHNVREDEDVMLQAYRRISISMDEPGFFFLLTRLPGAAYAPRHLLSEVTSSS